MFPIAGICSEKFTRPSMDNTINNIENKIK